MSVKVADRISKPTTNGHGKSNDERHQQPRSAVFAENGVRTDAEFAGMMSALMSDVLQGRITPSVCNAATNAGGKLLKVVEMQQKYGRVNENNVKELALFPAPAKIAKV